jgi:1,4-alpha-glucan branching enzyme
VGRLVREKGLHVLLQAVRLLKEAGQAFRLMIIGDGPERERLESMTRHLGLCDEVSFTGALRGDDLTRAVSEVGVIVMPSVLEETAGLAAIEQMMRGRAVIAADTGGLGEIVGDAGLKFAPGAAAALSSCLRAAAEDPEILAELGDKARRRALALFRQERMVEEHLRVFEALATVA